MRIHEIKAAVNRVKEEVDEEAKIIFGSNSEPDMKGKVKISIIATGVENV